jgi:hypothetical protein
MQCSEVLEGHCGVDSRLIFVKTKNVGVVFIYLM